MLGLSEIILKNGSRSNACPPVTTSTLSRKACRHAACRNQKAAGASPLRAASTSSARSFVGLASRLARNPGLYQQERHQVPRGFKPRPGDKSTEYLRSSGQTSALIRAGDAARSHVSRRRRPICSLQIAQGGFRTATCRASPSSGASRRSWSVQQRHPDVRRRFRSVPKDLSRD